MESKDISLFPMMVEILWIRNMFYYFGNYFIKNLVSLLNEPVDVIQEGFIELLNNIRNFYHIPENISFTNREQIYDEELGVHILNIEKDYCSPLRIIGAVKNVKFGEEIN